MEELTHNSTALPGKSIILGGRYRLVQLLHQRPRVNLYLGRRLSEQSNASQQDQKHQPLVAIRELVLTELSPRLRDQVEQAAFKEFVSLGAFSFSRLSGAGDRVYSEGDRHYLVMQLGRERGAEPMPVVTLAELLLSEQQWPLWLNMQTALAWSIQLCRIVARLHRSGVVLGDLNPATVLVDREGTAEWLPSLLASWPPAPQFWSPSLTPLSAAEDYRHIFPIAMNSTAGAFAAPETLKGPGDERSDVYSLGAILYLLLTGYAPTSALLRQRCNARFAHTEAGGSALLESLELIPPYFFNRQIPLALENVLMSALAFDPAERYASAFALVEALEALD